MSEEVIAQSHKGRAGSRKEHRKKKARLSEAQTVLGWSVILALAGLLGAIYLFQTSQIATVGRDVQFDQIELNSLKQQNAELQRDVTEAQSLERLRQEAARLGFVQASPEDIEYMIIPDYPTRIGELQPQEIEGPVEMAGSMREAVWLYFRSSLNDLFRGESS